mgnify:CR=1 FL=1
MDFFTKRAEPMVQFISKTVIASFGFARAIEKIDDLKSDFKSEENSESVFNDLKLPRFIVIGDENSGKSSTLERIAMVDVFPRNHKICTDL